METTSAEFVAAHPVSEGHRTSAVTPATRTFHVPVIPLKGSVASSCVKRLLDVLIAGLSLLLLFPLLLVVSFLIWREDRGPILYRHSRIGQYGVPFWFYKLRSMRVDADRVRHLLLDQSDVQGPAFKMKADPRITRIGRFIRKFSIDEVPQLFCVLAGHMSIIGPRPHLLQEVETYAPDHYARLLVKPGLLCLREVRGRSHISFEEWLKLDLDYIQSRSLLLDIKIFLLAFPAVFKGNGAY